MCVYVVFLHTWCLLDCIFNIISLGICCPCYHFLQVCSCISVDSCSFDLPKEKKKGWVGGKKTHTPKPQTFYFLHLFHDWNPHPLYSGVMFMVFIIIIISGNNNRFLVPQSLWLVVYVGKWNTFFAHLFWIWPSKTQLSDEKCRYLKTFARKSFLNLKLPIFMSVISYTVLQLERQLPLQTVRLKLQIVSFHAQIAQSVTA